MSERLRSRDVTPVSLKCPPFPGCPTIHVSDRDTYLIVGKVLNPDQAPQLRDRVGPGEIIIEVPRELIDGRAP